jgi:hypothetical protein
MKKFLSFAFGKHQVEVPATKLTLNQRGEQVAVLAHSGLRVRLSAERKARLV